MLSRNFIALLVVLQQCIVVRASNYENYYDNRGWIYLAQDVFLNMGTTTGSDEFYLNLWMPTNSYVALAFGGESAHIQSDMIVFVTETGFDS